jgi:hypothetical protein
VEIKKHKDNLKLEGTFEGHRSSNVYTVVKGERADVKKHADNL